MSFYHRIYVGHLSLEGKSFVKLAVNPATLLPVLHALTRYGLSGVPDQTSQPDVQPTSSTIGHIGGEHIEYSPKGYFIFPFLGPSGLNHFSIALVSALISRWGWTAYSENDGYMMDVKDLRSEIGDTEEYMQKISFMESIITSIV